MKRIFFATALLALAEFDAVTAHAQDRNRVIRMNRSVVVENLTGEVIYYFHATNLYDKVWDVDLLGNNVILPGERRRFNVDDYSAECEFDVLAKTKSNRIIAASGNVCGAGAYWVAR